MTLGTKASLLLRHCSHTPRMYPRLADTFSVVSRMNAGTDATEGLDIDREVAVSKRYARASPILTSPSPGYTNGTPDAIANANPKIGAVQDQRPHARLNM